MTLDEAREMVLIIRERANVYPEQAFYMSDVVVMLEALAEIVLAQDSQQGYALSVEKPTPQRPKRG